VGIGTTSPSYKLEVDNRAAATTATQSPQLFLTGGSNIGTDYRDGQIIFGSEIGTCGSLGWGNATAGVYLDNRWNNAIGFIAFRTKTSGTPVEGMRITGVGDVGINTTAPNAKLEVVGGIIAGGKTTYTIVTASLTTTGTAVAGVSTGTNGQSSGFIFTCFGGDSGYQRIVYSCKNISGTWDINKDIDEGVNGVDVTYAADGSDNITFTFKSRTVTQYYAPKVTVEAIGDQINQSYIN